MSLYRRVLGESFAALHPILQRFHADQSGGTGAGTLTVERRSDALGALLRLPLAGEDVPVTIRVEPTARGERWTRRFGDGALVTEQWARGALLCERAGPTTFGLAVRVTDGGGMRFTTRRAWLLGLPLPRPLAPSVDASVEPVEAGWRVRVTLSLPPPVGWVLRYAGEITPTWS